MNKLFASKDVNLLADFSDLMEILSISLTSPTRELALAVRGGGYAEDVRACLNGIFEDAQNIALFPLEESLSACAQACAAKTEDALYHELNQEYTRLFVAPKMEQLPPYESLFVHRDDRKASMFINPTCMHAEQVYRKSGFPFQEKGRVPGDHVAVELKYLAFLMAARIAALNAQDDAGAERASVLAQEFVQAHIVRWFGVFMRELAEKTEHPFYRAAALAAQAVEPVLIG